MTAATDVRQWLREQGHEIGVRGAIPRHLQDEYDAAHQPAPAKTVPGEVIDAGVTEADFPPDDFEQNPPDEGKPAAKGRERKPRPVKPPAARPLRERIFTRGAAGKGKAKARHPRVPLGDWAEETWTDLAWLAEPIPPLSKILTIQAPYAGVVFDDAVKGTPVDGMLQPVARYAGAFRALNGLAGPPVYVALICATGQRVQVGALEDGTPVMDFDARTKMMFAGLRYSLLQMTKIADVHAEQIRERTEAAAGRMAVVDAIIDSLFGAPPQASPPPAPRAPASAGGGDHANGYRYPDAPVMDDTGADPGRL